MTIQERRNYERFSVDVMDIHGKMLFANDVKILDISLGGILLKADQRLNIGMTYMLKLESQGKVLTVQGNVVRSILSESRRDELGGITPIYTAGMRFINLTNEKMKEVTDFIKEHIVDYREMAHFDENMFKMSGLRLYVRFRVQEPEKAVLHIQDGYKVKRISQGGMLIESDSCLEIEDNVPMEMTLPDGNVLTFVGRVIRCEPARNDEQQSYKVGVEFIEMSDHDRKRLEAFIASIKSDET